MKWKGKKQKKRKEKKVELMSFNVGDNNLQCLS